MPNNDRLTVTLPQTAPVRPATITTAVRRPSYLTSRTAQTVLLARDSSPSMSGQKSADATSASLELVDELAKPDNKNGFSIAVVDFSDDAALVHPAAPATSLHGNVRPIDTTAGSGTNIAGALDMCADILRVESRDGQRMYLRPVALLFSDGQPNVGGDPRAAASRVRDIADLVTVAFGADADEDLLRELATSPQHFYRCRNGRELRAFLAKVGQTLTQTLSQGRNATIALGTLSAK
jgi:uncharacterized protein YegL